MFTRSLKVRSYYWHLYNSNRFKACRLNIYVFIFWLAWRSESEKKSFMTPNDKILGTLPTVPQKLSTWYNRPLCFYGATNDMWTTLLLCGKKIQQLMTTFRPRFETFRTNRDKLSASFPTVRRNRRTYYVIIYLRFGYFTHPSALVKLWPSIVITD